MAAVAGLVIRDAKSGSGFACFFSQNNAIYDKYSLSLASYNKVKSMRRNITLSSSFSIRCLYNRDFKTSRN